MSFNFKYPVAYLEISDFDQNTGLLVGQFSKTPTLVMIQANYCGACTRSKPEFQKLANKKLSSFKTATVQLDGAKESERLVSNILDKIASGISTIPVYILFFNGKKIVYTGSSRSAEDLYRFVQQTIV